MSAIRERLKKRRIPFTDRIARQAQVPREQPYYRMKRNRSWFLFKAKYHAEINSPALFVLPGPPRELQPMFRDSALPILRSIVPAPTFIAGCIRIANMGESMVEKAIGERVLAIPDIELGYCGAPGEVDLRIIGKEEAVQRAEVIINSALADSIFLRPMKLGTSPGKILSTRNQTLAIAESCTGGCWLIAITNVPGGVQRIRSGYIVYSNDAKLTFSRWIPN